MIPMTKDEYEVLAEAMMRASDAASDVSEIIHELPKQHQQPVKELVNGLIDFKKAMTAYLAKRLD